jgi:sugar diacid utilization regulator
VGDICAGHPCTCSEGVGKLHDVGPLRRSAVSVVRGELQRAPRRRTPASLPPQRRGLADPDPVPGPTAEDALACAPDPSAALLWLLAEEAPAGELSRVAELVQARTGTDAAVRQVAASALAVRARLDERRRREQELAALYATAGDLSSLHDLEAVLQAIVRRARQLLDTDTAYLTLNDEERGVTYMRVTEGIRTEGFKQVHITMGAGLGGLVAESCTPYTTADYLADERFAHTIDDVVAPEGLVAVLGVPLRLGERAIGVLYAANRRERPFGADEVALLLSLADHAAIAIENASLFEDLHAALEDLRQASDVISARTEQVERAAAMHERLAAVMLGGGGLPQVADAVVDVLGGSFVVLDPGGRVLVSAGCPVADGLVAALAAPASRARSPRGNRALAVSGPNGEPVVIAPVFAGADVLGHVLAVGRELDEPDVRILERSAVVTALLLLQERSIADAEQRVRGELFDDLFATPQRDVEGLHRRALHLGVDLSEPHVVAVARVAEPGRAAAAWRAARAVHGTGGMSGQYRSDVVLLLAADDASAAARRVAGQLKDSVGCPVTVGAVGPGAGAAELAELYREAARCCDVLLSLGREGEAAGTDDLGIYGLLLSAAGQDELRRFVRRSIGPVIDYDAQRRSELVRTLLAYYGAGGNLTRTAQELYVHVNTLYQRLDRITTLLGERWRSGDGALQVHLALRLHAALDTVG